MHSACIENPRETSVAHPSSPRSSTSVAGSSSPSIHPFPRNFQSHTSSQEFSRHMSCDFLLRRLFLYSLSLRSIEKEREREGTSSAFSGLTLFSHSTIFPFRLRRQQFRLFEQRREYYSTDYARLFRLANPLRDFRHATGGYYCAVFLSRIYMYACVYTFIYMYICMYISFMANSITKFLSARYYWIPKTSLDGALRLFPPTNYAIKIFFFCNGVKGDEGLGIAKRHVSRKCAKCQSIAICESAVLI